MREVSYGYLVKRMMRKGKRSKPLLFKLELTDEHYRKFPMKRLYRYFNKNYVDFLDINECNTVWREEHLNRGESSMKLHWEYMFFGNGYDYYIYDSEEEFEREWALELLTNQ